MIQRAGELIMNSSKVHRNQLSKQTVVKKTILRHTRNISLPFFAPERQRKKIQSRPETPEILSVRAKQVFMIFSDRDTFYASINVAIIVGWNLEIV
jgi:hypothetical protein